MISGGFFGFLLGTFGGLFIYALTKATDVKMDDVYQLAKTYFVYKDRGFQNSFRVSILTNPKMFLIAISQNFIQMFMFLPIQQVQLEEPDILLETFYPDGIDSMTHTLDDLKDIKSTSELKFNKNPALKLDSELNQSVNSPARK